ncbi:MAG: hypothetical protein WA609_07790 [Terriglobales bacterium]
MTTLELGEAALRMAILELGEAALGMAILELGECLSSAAEAAVFWGANGTAEAAP